MRNDKTQAGTFDACTVEGSYIPAAKTDKGQIRAMANVALIDLESLKEWRKKAPKDSGQWNAIYKLSYDVLHTLAESFLLFDNVKARTHECLFAYLCEKYPELELDWKFLEKARTLRNRSAYYGEPVSHERWKEIEFQMDLYIDTLKKIVDKKLDERNRSI